MTTPIPPSEHRTIILHCAIGFIPAIIAAFCLLLAFQGDATVPWLLAANMGAMMSLATWIRWGDQRDAKEHQALLEQVQLDVATVNAELEHFRKLYIGERGEDADNRALRRI